MKTHLLRTLLLLLIVNCSLFTAKAQWVSIPDTNFGTWLSTRYVPCIQGNNAIGWQMDTTCPAVLSATSISCFGRNIRNLEGIQYFDSLRSLTCNGNGMTNLSALPGRLTRLWCYDNNLTSLPPLPNSLTWLICYDNLLTTLPQLNDSLEQIKCYQNQLTTLPVLPLRLSILECYSNQITVLPSLPLSLTDLDCRNNQLSALPPLHNGLLILRCDDNPLGNIGPLPATLTNLGCSGNQLTSLPVLPYGLRALGCNDNLLTSLPALPNSITSLHCNANLLTHLPELPDSLFSFDCRYNPNLRCLPQLKVIQQFWFDFTGITCLPNYPKRLLQPLYSIPLCDIFNPNQCPSFSNISGAVFYDTNGNCVQDSTENWLPNIPLKLLSNASALQETYSVGLGSYSFIADTLLTHSLWVDTTSIPFQVICPFTGIDTIALTPTDSIFYNRNFALQCKAGFDLKAHSMVAGRFRPANFTTVNVSAGDATNFYGAHCAAGISGVVTITFNGAVSYVGPASGALTPIVSGNTLTYNVANFGTVNFFTDFSFVLHTDTNAVLGSQVCISVSVTPTTGDNNPANNTLTNCFNVVGSYDPNDKAVSPPGNIDTAQEWLTYTIRFQNTGTDTAIHIYITDTLDSDLDASSFQLLAYSHQPMVQIVGNAVRFNFPNIMLVDSHANEPLSHGYVQYRVRVNSTLAIGAEINNTAYIYFDFNAPVITNTVTNTVVDTTGNCLATSASIADTICSNGLYFFGGALITNTGVYYDTLTNANGCDSVVQLNLSVVPANDIFISATICEGETYAFDGQQLDTTGVYYQLLSNVYGCDSFIELTLTVYSPTSSAMTASICDNETYPFDGQLLNTAGVYYDTLTNSNGCDSTIELTLTVLSTSATSIADTVCENELFVFGGQVLNTSGVYTDTLSNANGCDSIVTLSLTVDTFFKSNITHTMCEGDSFSFGGAYLTQAGIYYDTVSSGAQSCDMVVTLTLNVGDINTTTIDTAIVQGSSYTLPSGITVVVAGVYTDTLTGSNSCDSIVTVNLSVISGIYESAIGNPQFEIFPNPASDAVTISVDETMVGGTLTVSDVIGRRVMAVQLATRNMQLATMPLESGVYFVTVGNATKKLVVSKH